MRPIEFAPESVVKAGQELQTTGRNVTGFALRQKVGGGNPARLKLVWDEHLASQSATEAEPVAELPVEVAEDMAAVTKALTERLARFAAELNDKAIKAAERRVHELARSAGEQRAQADQELADAAQTVDDLEGKLDEATAQADTLARKLAEAQDANHAQAVSNARTHERMISSEQAVKVNQVLHEQECVRLRAELAEQRKATESDVMKHEKARREFDSFRSAVESEHQVIDDKLRTAEWEVRRAAERATKAEADAANSQGEAGTAQKEASAAREEAAELRGQLEATKQQLAEFTRIVASKPVEQVAATDT